MKIAVVSSNTTILPPPRDGGTERIVFELSEEIAKRGHEVILYARGGSRSSGTLYSYPFDEFFDFTIGRYVQETLPPNVDIIHDHTFSSIMSSLSMGIPIVSTRHIPKMTDASHPVYVSNEALHSVGRGKGTFIYNGISPEAYQFSPTKQDYLLFLGRIVPSKGVAQAIEVAEQTNSRLIIAGPKHDTGYFNRYISPKLKNNHKLTYVGPVGGQERQDLLKYARCVLFPIQWSEPFGLVMIESLACGTPVLALNKGSVKEVLHGLPHYICNTPSEMAGKLRYIQNMYTPWELRNYVSQHFHINNMTEGYLQYYMKVIHEKHHLQR
ncbi:glycosyltransferase family 4 protein [Paenibacillus albiflavus]|uniref:Glycosyltransferase family 4 protein n=1 Tax=Paenibacillus albiflavus TaxID=2545760 RepID=A0A4R4ELY7_9BACL|nr:glycosyltransferase [Paenibacillus albiflavus]TCZ80807.1 glycosyltransferase family 4 protein [Paenibacillus albiflavus]